MAVYMYIATAESAQDIAAALEKFLDPVSDRSTEITALISECYAISSALRELNTCHGDLRYHSRPEQVSNDIRVALQSINYTFDDVRHFLGGLGDLIYPSQTAAYRAVWTNFNDHFEQESGNTLCRRLEFYRRFILAFICLIEGSASPSLVLGKEPS